MWLHLAVDSQTSILCALLAEGCPGLCNGNGRCTLDLNGWHCVCQLGWRGAGCDTSMETACGDSKDNDGGRAVVPMSPTQLWGGGDSGWRVGFTELMGHQYTSWPVKEACKAGIKLYIWPGMSAHH